jgi:tetratricopeptide (TPR) repeat protein
MTGRPTSSKEDFSASRVKELLARALERHKTGKLQEAERLYQKVLRQRPEHFDALHMLGVIALHSGRTEYSIDLISRAVREKPDIAAAHWHLGLALMHRERFQEAIGSFERQIQLQSDCLDPCIKIASAMSRLGRPREALASCNCAVSIRPDIAATYLVRAVILKDLEQHEESLAACARAIELQPESADAWDKHGAALRDLGRVEEALASHMRAIELQPDFSLAYMHAGMVALQMADCERGWPLYEKRTSAGGPPAAQAWKHPRWTGEQAISGTTLFLHWEQGLGDTIQFCRYAKQVEALGAKVALAVQPSLRRLLKSLSPNIQVVSDGEVPSKVEFCCPLMSLPFAFKTTVKSVLWDGPYLSAEPERVAHWRTKLGTGGFKIGICWQGSKLPVDVGRSFPLAHFEQLSTVPGVRLISLQKGAGSEQLAGMPLGMRVEDFGPELDSDGGDAFIDTAAIMEAVDLVITSDTAVAHLSGALGRPTWLALKQIPDWRWLLETESSPWYPTHRLFRQERRGDWGSVFERMRAVLINQGSQSAQTRSQ